MKTLILCKNAKNLEEEKRLKESGLSICVIATETKRPYIANVTEKSVLFGAPEVYSG